jgi:hypothetical protein
LLKGEFVIMAEINNTKVVTGKVRFSFVNVFEAKAFGEGQTPKYSVMLLIPKSDVGTINRIKKAIDAAAQKGLTTKFGGKLPAVLRTTLKDADKDTDQDGEIFADKWDYTAGHYIINVSSKIQPQIVDADLNPIINPVEFYSGCYGRASINFFAYNNQGNKGISAGLNNLQKLEDGEALGGVTTAEQDFANNI